MVSLMVQNVTLASPLAEAFQLVEFLVGPLGSIDMKAIPCPASVKQLVASGLDVLRAVLATSPTASTLYLNMNPGSFNNLLPVPKTFASQSHWYEYGGNILCDDFGGNNFGQGWLTFTSRTYACDQTVSALLQPTKDVVLLAGILAGFPLAENATLAVMNACSLLWPDDDTFRDLFFVETATFLVSFVPQRDKIYLESVAATAFKDASAVHVKMMQYIRKDPTQPLVRAEFDVLDASEPGFHFWGWMYIVEWALGNRDVVSFQGDAGSIHLVTEFAQTIAADVQPHDLPTVLAVYTRALLLYVTGAMLAITVLVIAYVATCGGFVEGSNLTKLNRVAGIVWIGRPLLLLRSLSALCLLSTATLDLALETPGVSYFRVPHVPWYSTILSAGEATWLVYILNDISLLWTHHYTSAYATASSLLVWIVAAILTLLWPVEHRAMMTPTCEIDQMDFQLVCQSGTVAIGQVTRLWLLLGIVGTSNTMCYVATRAWFFYRGQERPLPYSQSFLLSAGSQYLFDTTHWIHGGKYHLDRASALLNGLVTLHWRRTIFVVDVKIWRSFVIPLDDGLYLPKHLKSAVPLTE
ncbi:Aste57867_18643 [Aphanomyces stellatus]|uniref:Aste57867_18643 protein n=1 Tax=Aphanomyces stellatus TaxID=120398 RepID=A0A485LC59_9STRA|nr:hypothetical protein As57867_018581 [Aphanomyces stellatus]VFT95378.1 Aste57867_18643 [Aphanomyces stellatus]